LLNQFKSFSFGSSSARAFRFSAQGFKPALVIWEGVADSAFWSSVVGISVDVLAFDFLFPLRDLQQQQEMGIVLKEVLRRETTNLHVSYLEISQARLLR